MQTFHTNMSDVCSKMKNFLGEKFQNKEIPFIETLAGRYDGINVLEGVSANTEILCNEEDPAKYDYYFYKMFIRDEMIIFEITAQEEVKIPHMDINVLNDIILRSLS